MIETIIYIGNIFLTGALLYKLFDFEKHFNFYIKLVISFILGSIFYILFFYGLYYFSALNLISLSSSLLLFIINTILFIWIYRAGLTRLRFLQNFNQWFLLELVTFIGIIKAILLSNLAAPFIANDTLAIWLLKVKSLYLTDSFPDSIIANSSDYIPAHVDYPIGFSLLISGLLRSMGSFDEFYAKVLYILPYLALFTLITGVLRNYLNLGKFNFLIPILALSAIISSRFLLYSMNGGMDLIIALSFAVVISYISLQKENLTFQKVLNILFLASFALFVKNEGLIFFIIAGLITFLSYFYTKIRFRDSFKNIFNEIRANRWRLLWQLVLVLPVIAWFLVLREFDVQNDLAGQVSIYNILVDSGIERAKFIAFELGKYLWTQDFGMHLRFALITIFILITLSIYTKGLEVLKQSTLVAALIIFAQLAAYFMVYLVTPRDLYWHVATSVDRLILQLMPSFVIVAITMIGERNLVVVPGKDISS